jgi:uncharacterized protein YihD (DUF1040 family)
MLLGDLNENQQEKYISEMKNIWSFLSLEFRNKINDVAFNFIEDRFFLYGQKMKPEIGPDGRFDEMTKDLVLSYAVDLKTSEKKTYLSGFDNLERKLS